MCEHIEMEFGEIKRFQDFLMSKGYTKPEEETTAEWYRLRNPETNRLVIVRWSKRPYTYLLLDAADKDLVKEFLEAPTRATEEMIQVPRRSIEECIEQLAIDGENTKQLVRGMLQDILE